MKKYKTMTVNRGTTIILDNLSEAIAIAESEKRHPFEPKSDNCTLSECYEAIEKGNPELNDRVNEVMENLIGLVDNINPKFSQAHDGLQTATEGFTTTADLIMSGEENCMLKKKLSEFELKEGSGEGAYRILLNTDISWWGNEVDNDAIVGSIITLLQRFAPVEVWIQQGWLGCCETDGVTLFKLDFTSTFNPAQLSFWINHKGKDIPFSHQINKVLGRQNSRTSIKAEIDCDMMLRGDWMRTVGIDSYDFSDKLFTDKCDIMAKYINLTSMKILTGESGDETYESFVRI